MRKYVVPIGLGLLVSVMVTPAQQPVHQVSIPAMEDHPKIPSSFGIIDFRQRARHFDNFVYDWNQSYKDRITITWGDGNQYVLMPKHYCNDPTDNEAIEEMAAVQFVLPFGAWNRLSSEPVIAPQGTGFESAGTFNPAAIEKDGKVVVLYRAQDRRGTSRLGYAVSEDGVHFKRWAKPVFGPETPYEKGGGTEDPRVVEINGTYYMTYTGYNNVDGVGPGKRDAQLCLATSSDLIHWVRHGVILPAYKGKWNTGWTKSGAILPEKINGKYWMYYLADANDAAGQMGVACSEDLLHWSDALDHPVISTRPKFFDSKVAEPGPPPVVTPEGILLVYNGADDKLVYSTGWALFDKGDPTKVIVRADKPIFHPVKTWEKVGQVPNVVFVEGLVRRGAQWLFYYGGADKGIGVVAAESR